jgi:methylated-DNA-protein-cysteine methyltransferase related protein
MLNRPEKKQRSGKLAPNILAKQNVSAKPHSAGEMVTSFAQVKQKIIALILEIPHGQVASYGQIGELAGFARSARLVARCLRAPEIPNHVILPWWRVVRADGSCAVPGQLQRLRDEGVVAEIRIDMRRYRWQALDFLLFG